ncbi:MAG: hypothetical protein ACRCZO_04325 [Cetobacterium sp.]|uniref:hypothetical protein n=1 Tax=Cetobacterium sp. TaxID=2071632 RepID=UPI003EE7289A
MYYILLVNGKNPVLSENKEALFERILSYGGFDATIEELEEAYDSGASGLEEYQILNCEYLD